MNRSYKSEGIVISRRDFSEADRIVTIYSKNYGKITTIAKGVRRPSSRKRGALEIFTQIKFSAAKGKSLDVLTEVDSIDDFNRLRNNLKKVSVAYFFVETINRSTADSEEDVNLYDLLLEHIRLLYSRNDLKTLREEFIERVLIRLGYWPKGKVIGDHDKVLETVLEKPVNSKRIGKIVLT